jgi:hypothetical protein
VAKRRYEQDPQHGEVSTLAGYADTSTRGQVHFVISTVGNHGETRFRLHRAIARRLKTSEVSPNTSSSAKPGRRSPIDSKSTSSKRRD